MTFSFGQSERERIEVDVTGYESLVAGANWFDNWLAMQVSVQAGAFHGSVSASFIADELVRFLAQLRPLYDTLSGTAEFATMERQLIVRLVGDGTGHIELRGEVADSAGACNRLHFILVFDQTQLRTSICEIERVISQFPSRVS